MQKKDIGKRFFLLGVFFLASVPVISVIFFLISVVKSSNNKFRDYLRDRWNKVLLIISILMIISCSIQSFLGNPLLFEFNKSLTWIGLINWLPLFWCFWAFQPYLNNSSERRKTSIYLISGTIPVIFSGLAQYWFNITGPWELFYGIITWYQRPLEITDGLTGPFNNANYAGAWLAIVWPFLLADFREDSSNFKKFISFLLILFFTISVIFTNSRNAWIGLILSVPFLLGKKALFWTLITIILFSLIIFSSYLPFIPQEIKELIINFLPYNFMSNFPDTANQLSVEFPRLEIWKYSLYFIYLRPLFGWGAASFPILYELENKQWIGHAHNLPFEIAISYGVLPSIILSFFVLLIIIKYIRFEIKISNSITIKTKSPDLINKAWICSTIFLVLAHLFDIQYFDLRISIISWILLAGIRCSILEANNKLDY